MIYFQEVQKFRQKILWIFIIILCGGIITFSTINLINYIFLGNEIENQSITKMGIILFGVFSYLFSFLLVVFFLRIKLETIIDQNGLKYKFWPFINKFKEIPFSNIKDINVVTYSPIKEFGGWGYRVSFRGNGYGFNVSGNHGIRIHDKEGKKLLIGTQKAEELKSVLKQLKEEKLYEI